ncbi:MAG TPA: sterol desaturase family protein [Pyrinomonadaceae bacterium]|nr:sterol desaturase family protein [Pyrinomonadaceae bacterium]
MLQQLIAILSDFFMAVARVHTLPKVLGFVATFTLVVIISVRQGRGRRFFGRAFRTDLAHSAWFPIYTVLIGIPLWLGLAGVVTHFVPFLRFNLLSGFPVWLKVVVWFVVYDFVSYWLHRLMHQTPWLWVLHKVHHSQKELNPLTSWRVHWLEFVYLGTGAFITGLVLGDFGPLHPIGFGLLAASQLAQHSDIDWTYGPIGKLIVSPRFHARHHSVAPEDVNVNFGSLLIFWDWLFGTARNVRGRAPGYGLVGADDDVPASFLGQQLYPLSILLRRKLQATRSDC